MTTATKTDRIRALNDDLRQHLIGGGRRRHPQDRRPLSGSYRPDRQNNRCV
jgi:hypothetical protein